MIKYDTIFLDRDGTLNFDPGYIKSINQFNFFRFTIPALQALARNGNRFCIITNQSGLGRGLIVLDKLEEIHKFIKHEFKHYEIPLLNIYYCPDHPSAATKFRKPGTGMFTTAAEDFNIILKNSLMIGDGTADMEAAANLKMDSMLVKTGRGEETFNKLPAGLRPTYIVKNLKAGADLLLGKSNK
ncbi:MAG: HAD-IIIA family hydrolase [Candidatus Neomarinimicrobiota bacterium]